MARKNISVAQAQEISKTIDVRPRNIDFEIGEEITYNWNGDNPGYTTWLNAMSLNFPVGEQLFVDSARACLPMCDNTELKKQVRGFMTQESIHSREHDHYNDMLKRGGVPVEAYKARGEAQRAWVKRTLSPYWQLAFTVAAEHFTATISEVALKDRKKLFKDADPKMAAIWVWHAVEESEHKAVCFDLMRDVSRSSFQFYFARSIAGLFTLCQIYLTLPLIYYYMAKHTGELGNGKAFWGFLNYHFGRPGLLRKFFPAFLSYFKPGFHPWQRDNRDIIEEWDQEAPSFADYPQDALGSVSVEPVPSA